MGIVGLDTKYELVINKAVNPRGKVMAEVSTIVGITFMVIGSLLVSLGLFLCYTTKGEYYNQDEVQAMVTAEVLEEEKKRREENAQIEAEMAEAAAAMQSQQLEPEKANTAK